MTGTMKRMIAVLMILLMFVLPLGGCGNTAVDETAKKNTPSDSTGGETDPAAMGRYVEEVTDISSKISGYGNGLYRLDNGNLVITDIYMDFLRSEDNGKDWMTDSRSWQTRMLEEMNYIMSLAIGADNTVALIYDDTAAEDADGQEADEITEEDAGSQTEGDTSAEAADSQTEGDTSAEDTDSQDMEDASAEETELSAEEELMNFELNPHLAIIKPDNTEIPVEIELTEDDSYLYQVYIADNGRIFVTTMGSGNIYEVKEDGSSELFLISEGGRPELLCVQNNLMVMDGYGYENLLIYDMEKKEYIEDEVLNTFITDHYSDRHHVAGDGHPLYFFFGENDIIYLAGEKGLHRHVVGGNAVEQIIDGTLCSFGNPAYIIQGMTAIEENEFLVLFSGGRVVHYVFDENIPTVPTGKLQVYSLEDNETIRQAIHIYQQEHPDLYVEFICGMDSSSSVTRDDALKNLNTKIMAGEGPDVLVLDNMPIESYINKGLLLDLSTFAGELNGNGNLFQNVVEAVKTDDKLYAVPCEISLPIIMADKEYVSQTADLEDMADIVETLRAETPGEDILGFYSEKGIMYMLSMSCASSWITAEGQIDTNAVTEFLKQSKRIYDAQMDDIDEDAGGEYVETDHYDLQYLGGLSYSDDVRTGTDFMSYLGGYTQMVCGVLNNIYTYSCITSLQRMEDFQNAEWSGMKGQAENVFREETILGVSAVSEHTERAQDFIRTCLGEENQQSLYYGLPVNKASLKKVMEIEEEEMDEEYEYAYGSYTISDAEGLFIHLEIYRPNEELQDALIKYMESVDTVYMKDEILENAVFEEGVAYIQGTKSLEDAVSAIEKKISIYMAE